MVLTDRNIKWHLTVVILIITIILGGSVISSSGDGELISEKMYLYYTLSLNGLTRKYPIRKDDKINSYVVNINSDCVQVDSIPYVPVGWKFSSPYNDCTNCIAVSTVESPERKEQFGIEYFRNFLIMKVHSGCSDLKNNRKLFTMELSMEAKNGEIKKYLIPGNFIALSSSDLTRFSALNKRRPKSGTLHCISMSRPDVGGFTMTEPNEIIKYARSEIVYSYIYAVKNINTKEYAYSNTYSDYDGQTSLAEYEFSSSVKDVNDNRSILIVEDYGNRDFEYASNYNSDFEPYEYTKDCMTEIKIETDTMPQCEEAHTIDKWWIK